MWILFYYGLNIIAYQDAENETIGFYGRGEASAIHLSGYLNF